MIVRLLKKGSEEKIDELSGQVLNESSAAVYNLAPGKV
jgi:hypothetical protein